MANRYAAIILLATSLSACGADKISSYKPPESGITRIPESPPSDSNQTGQLDTPESPTNLLRDSEFNTGLPQCVKTGLQAKGAEIFLPRVIRASTDLLNQSPLSSNEDFSQLYDIILREIVTPEDGLVAYSRIREGGDLRALWQKLTSYLPNLDLTSLDTDSEKIAFWVNLYNIVMIDILTEDANALSFVGRLRTFSKVTRQVAGYTVTLDTIEYAILDLGEKQVDNPLPPSTLPSFSEKRLHVALVCGAKSCPKLRNFAYEADSLAIVLEENAHMFFNDGVKHFARNTDGSYKISSLFNWFSKDFDVFGGSRSPAELSRYFLESCRNDISDANAFLSGIDNFSSVPRDNLLSYDWSPNEFTE